MTNMFNVLYNQYIQQIKLQEIENYNRKHQDYLIRSGLANKNVQIAKSRIPVPKIQKKHQFERQSQKSVKLNHQSVHQSTKLNHQFANQNQIPSNQLLHSQNRKNTNTFQSNSYQRPININKPVKPNNNYTSFQTLNTQSNNNYQPSQRQIQTHQNNKYQNHNNLRQTQQIKQNTHFPNQFQQQQENIVLQECPEGCGRKFKISVLEKHIKICQKVFQGKRKPFKVDVVDDQAKKLAGKKSPLNQEPKNKTQKVPKWKKQSEMLRKGLGLKAQKQGEMGQSSVVQEQADDRVKCGGCGRKFNQVAAQKHIPGCLKRSKQMR